jgi:acetyl esterase/lipase
MTVKQPVIALAIFACTGMVCVFLWLDWNFRPDTYRQYQPNGAQGLGSYLYEPRSDRTLYPAVILYHGGGWSRGSPWTLFPYARRFAQAGFLVLVPEYRVHERHGTGVFDALADAGSAYRWLVDHAEELHVDTRRIVLGGDSAGGQLAAVVALQPEYRGSSIAPAALVLLNPVTDTSEPARRRKGDYQTLFAGRGIEASPRHLLRPESPPVVVFHGNADRLVPVEQSVRFCRRAELTGNRCDLHRFPGARHGFFKYPWHWQAVTDMAIAFLGELGVHAPSD